MNILAGIVYFSFLLTAHTSKGNPVRTMHADDHLLIEQFLKDRSSVQVIDKILTGMEGLVAESLTKLFNKINSLTQVTEFLLQEGQNATVSEGIHGDMSSRCPKDFQAVAGDKNCYYLSTYKQPWVLAREFCLQMGAHVDMLSIETTKKQFIVTHLIQNDPELKHVKRWWTSGRGTGRDWAWNFRIKQTLFFFKFFRNEVDRINPDKDSCMVLDGDNYYQWKKVRCNDKTNNLMVRDEAGIDTDFSQQPAHHFICQTPALEPHSIEKSTTSSLGNTVGSASIQNYRLVSSALASQNNTVDSSTRSDESSSDIS